MHECAHSPTCTRAHLHVTRYSMPSGWVNMCDICEVVFYRAQPILNSLKAPPNLFFVASLIFSIWLLDQGFTVGISFGIAANQLNFAFGLPKCVPRAHLFCTHLISAHFTPRLLRCCTHQCFHVWP